MKNGIAALSAAFALTACGATLDLDENRNGKQMSRAMTGNEITLARTIFGDQINYGAVRISKQTGNTNNGFGNRARFTTSIYSEDFGLERNLHKRAIFIHEMAHLWQEDKGVNVIDSAINLFFRHDGDYSRAYEYDINTVVSFNTLNIEQQAEIIEDLFRKIDAVTHLTTSLYCPQIEQYQEVLAPYLPHIQTPALCR